MMKKAMAGFTLAEVLTTLMVIGVVAAMTIPTLMNSTSDQQARVAYKKAMSVLGQGIQLMIAKEDECTVATSHDLADCMNKVIAGSLYNTGTSNSDTATLDANNGNVIVTADGMAYAFYYAPADDDNTGGSRTLDSICGDSMPSTTDGFSGADSRCIVVVDTNGVNKGTKYFGKAAANGAAVNQAALTNSDVVGDEQAALTLSGAGVRPTFNKDETSVSRGYQFMYGTGKASESNVSPFSS